MKYTIIDQARPSKMADARGSMFTIIDPDGLDIALAADRAGVRDFARQYGSSVVFLSEDTAQLVSH